MCGTKIYLTARITDEWNRPERYTVTAIASHFARTVLQLDTHARIQHKHWINSSLQVSCFGRFANACLVCSSDGDTCTFTSTVRQQLNASYQLRWINRVSVSCWLFPSLSLFLTFSLIYLSSIIFKMMYRTLEHVIYETCFIKYLLWHTLLSYINLQRIKIFLSLSISL